MLPLLVNGEPEFKKDEYIFIPDVRNAILDGRKEIKAFVIGETVKEISLSVGDLTGDEKDIITAGCLINYYRE